MGVLSCDLLIQVICTIYGFPPFDLSSCIVQVAFATKHKAKLHLAIMKFGYADISDDKLTEGGSERAELGSFDLLGLLTLPVFTQSENGLPCWSEENQVVWPQSTSRVSASCVQSPG